MENLTIEEIKRLRAIEARMEAMNKTIADQLELEARNRKRMKRHQDEESIRDMCSDYMMNHDTVNNYLNMICELALKKYDENPEPDRLWIFNQAVKEIDQNYKLEIVDKNADH